MLTVGLETRAASPARRRLRSECPRLGIPRSRTPSPLLRCNKAAAATKERGQALILSHRAQQPPLLESVIDVSDIDVVLQRAAEDDLLLGDDAHDASLTAAFGSGLINLDGTRETEEERRWLRQEQEVLHADNLRPPWTAQMTVEELDANERWAFLEWRRNLARLEENEKLVLTPFEKNIDIWRQLWRVLERTDLIYAEGDSSMSTYERRASLREL